MKYIVTTLALALVLSASAVAGAQALIGSSQIANRSIRLVDIHPSVVKALRGSGVRAVLRAYLEPTASRPAGPGRCRTAA